MNAYLVIEKSWYSCDAFDYLESDAEKKNVCIALTKEDADKAFLNEKENYLKLMAKWHPVVDGNSVIVDGGSKIVWEIVAIPLYS